MDSFTLGNLLIVREPQYPYFWLVKRDGIVIDRDQYSNDIRERFASGVYSATVAQQPQVSITDDLDYETGMYR